MKVKVTMYSEISDNTATTYTWFSSSMREGMEKFFQDNNTTEPYFLLVHYFDNIAYAHTYGTLTDGSVVYVQTNKYIFQKVD